MKALEIEKLSDKPISDQYRISLPSLDSQPQSQYFVRQSEYWNLYYIPFSPNIDFYLNSTMVQNSIDAIKDPNSFQFLWKFQFFSLLVSSFLFRAVLSSARILQKSQFFNNLNLKVTFRGSRISFSEIINLNFQTRTVSTINIHFILSRSELTLSSCWSLAPLCLIIRP